MKIYILQGSCGEYSDRTDWIVRAYRDKDAADADQLRATIQARDFEASGYEQYPISDEEIDEEAKLRAQILTVDPAAQFDYTGTTYWVVECELVA